MIKLTVSNENFCSFNENFCSLLKAEEGEEIIIGQVGNSEVINLTKNYSCRNMTIKQIEQELGFKIQIVDERY